MLDYANRDPVSVFCIIPRGNQANQKLYVQSDLVLNQS